MKKAFPQKIFFSKFFLPICAAILFSACDLFQESPKDFLEDYASIATVATYTVSGNAIPQGAYLNVGSDDDVTITYFVDNPGNHRLRAAVSFSGSLNASDCDFVFPENNSLLRSVTKLEDDGEGNPTQTLQPETETNFLTSTFSIEIPSGSLAGIDGKVSLFNISPTVTLYRADFGEEERMQSLHTIPLRCNTPPASIDAAVGQMIETTDADGSDLQKLVLAIKLPTLKDDDKYLHVSENGRTHTFAAHFADGDLSTDGLWEISSSAPSGIKATYDGGDSAPAGANCYITTNINIKGRSPFVITLTLADESGLSSSFEFTSHGQRLLPPWPTSNATTFVTEESDGMAIYTLEAESGATIHYTAESAGVVYSESSGASPLAIKLPAGTFDITAYATKSGIEKSNDFTSTITVTPSVFFVSANGSDTDGNGSKLKPFATIDKAATSFPPPPVGPEKAKIFLLSDIEVNAGNSCSDMLLQGCAGGNKGSRVTVSCNLSSGQTAFSIGGSVEMRDLNITQTASSAVIASAISLESGAILDLQNVSITGMNTTGGAVVLKDGTLNILGGVKITGNTSAGVQKNLYLHSGKTFNVLQNGSLTGTQIGVFTEKKPDSTASVKITSGFNTAGYNSSNLSSITSDEGFGLRLDGGEAALSASGGSITITPPAEIKFSFDSADSSKSTDSGNGGGITIYAFGDGTLITDMTDFTTFTAEIYQGSVSIGKHFDKNSFRFEPSWNLDNGTYVIKITANYGGIKFSGELYYTKTP